MERMSLNEQLRKSFYCSNCEQEGHKKNNCLKLNPIAKSNFTRYYPQLPSTQSQYTPPDPDSDNEDDGYDEENDGSIMHQKKKQSPVNDKLARDTNVITPLESSQPETYNQLLSKLS